MSRYIDADELKASYIVTSTTSNSLCHLYVSLEDINSAPSIDIVFCGECRLYNCGACFRDDGANNERRVNDFCSYGERKKP